MVVVLYDIFAGMASQKKTVPLLVIEIIKSIAIVAYQATGTAAHPHEAITVLIDIVHEIAGQTIVHGQHIEMVALRLESAARQRSRQPNKRQRQESQKGDDMK